MLILADKELFCFINFIYSLAIKLDLFRPVEGKIIANFASLIWIDLKIVTIQIFVFVNMQIISIWSVSVFD